MSKEEKVEIIRQALLTLGLILKNDVLSNDDYLLCEGHIGPATTPYSLARTIAPFYPTPKPVILPDNTLRDHINDLVMEVLAREKMKARTTEPFRTLRDEFAMAAPVQMPEIAKDGMLRQGDLTWPERLKHNATARYEWADAMLAAARKTK